MATYVQTGNRVEEIELLDLFEAPEGSIEQYYGKVGNGKTANGTYDILKDLNQGRVVYANWILNWDGFDQRDSFFHVFRSIVVPFARRFYVFRKDNLKYIEIDEHFVENFEKITDATVYLDEGHVAFDSYEMAKMSLRKRKAVLHTRHFNRTLKILSQRPTAIHVSLRANVNIFYKCEKIMHIPFFGILFRRTEFQELEKENVDETKPEHVDYRLIPFQVLNAYDSKYMRKGQLASQTVEFEAYDLSYSDRLATLWFMCLRFARLALRLKPGADERSEPKNFEYRGIRAKFEEKSLGVEDTGATIKNDGQGGPNRPSSEAQDTLPF